jgi:flagellar basal body-associated protein FliL
MNKESIIAIVLGLVLGILVAGGVVYLSVRQQRIQNTQITQSATPDAGLSPVVVPPWRA